MPDVRLILDFLETRLDTQRIETSRQRLAAALRHQPTDRLAVAINVPVPTPFTPLPYSQCFVNHENMFWNELCSAAQSALRPGDSLPMVRANYGVGIMPSLFGAQSRVVGENLPWCEALGEEAIPALLDRGIPPLDTGLAGQVLEAQTYMTAMLADYPRCKEQIPLFHPDMQGPFDVAHLIWGNGIYYTIYDQPELLKDFLQLVTDTYIAYLHVARADMNDRWHDNVHHWGSLFPGAVVLRNDTAVNISQQQYLEFVQPYDVQVLEAVGGGTIHYCGRGDQWVERMVETPKLRCMNFGQFVGKLVFGIPFLEKVHPLCTAHGLGIQAYTMPVEILRTIPGTPYQRGISWSTQVDTIDQAKRLLDELQCKEG